MKFYKIRNAEGKHLRGPSRYLWDSNWVKEGKTWGRFAHALAALRLRAPYWEPEQLAGVVIVEISDTGERTLDAKAALDGERFPELPAVPEGVVQTWGFWDETGSFIGGFATPEEAAENREVYFKYLNQPRPESLFAAIGLTMGEVDDLWEEIQKEYP